MAGAESRVRWNGEEKAVLGSEVSRLLAANPHMSQLAAVRMAQDALPEGRRRQITSWTSVASYLSPYLAPMGTATPSAPQSVAVTRETEAAQKSVDVTLPGTFPLDLEAALLVALQSPVIKRALAELLASVLEEGVAKSGGSNTSGDVSGSEHIPTARPDHRILVAGFPENQSKALEKALQSLCEVRTWRPSQPQQMFEASVRLCSIVVIPESMPDEVDDFLQEHSVTVFRHGGTTERLLESVHELLAA